MEIIYCDSCGKRIKDAEGQRQANGGACCAACAPKPVAAASGAATKIDSAPKAPPSSPRQPIMRESSTEMLQPDLRTLNRRSTLLTQKPNRNAPAEPSGAGKQTTIMAAAAGVVVLLILAGVMLASGSPKQETRAAKPPVTQSSAKSTSPAPIPPAVPAPAPTPPPTPVKVEKTPADEAATNEPSVNDIRENFARRSLDQLIQKEKTKALSAYQYRKDLQAFAASYGSTKAGKDAAEMLKTIPEVAPPAETLPPVVTGESKVVYFTAFESEEDMKFWREGTQVTENAYGGAGSSLRLGVIKNNWFSGGVNYGGGWSGKNLPIGPNAWIRFAYRFEKGDNFCIQVHEGSNLWQKHVFKLPQGKWQYYTVKFAEMDNLTKGGPKAPPEGATVKAILIFGGHDGIPISLCIDQVTLGDGPIPEVPQIP